MEDKRVLNEKELENVTGGTEPGEWNIPENGLPRPSRHTEPLNNTPGLTPDANEEWKSEIPELPGPGKYEIYGVAWGED